MFFCVKPTRRATQPGAPRARRARNTSHLYRLESKTRARYQAQRFIQPPHPLTPVVSHSWDMIHRRHVPLGVATGLRVRSSQPGPCSLT